MKNLRSLIRSVWIGLNTHKLRSFLTILGVVIGVALIFFVWRNIVGLYAAASGFEAFERMAGSWAYQFQLWLGLVAPLILMAIPVVRQATWGKIVASALALAGVFFGIAGLSSDEARNPTSH